MSKAAQQSEPSMEEILASIRKIISDENDAPAEQAAKPAEKPEPAPEPAPAAEKQEPAPPVEDKPSAAAPSTPAEDDTSDDILELTDDMVADTPKKVEPVDPEVSFDDVTAEEPVAQAEPEKAAESGFSSAAIADRLISPTTDAAVGSAFGKLANTILSRDSHTLEDLVKEMLRPMLQEWLDDNLPNMVEKLVREEIERVSRGR